MNLFVIRRTFTYKRSSGDLRTVRYVAKGYTTGGDEVLSFTKSRDEAWTFYSRVAASKKMDEFQLRSSSTVDMEVEYVIIPVPFKLKPRTDLLI